MKVFSDHLQERNLDMGIKSDQSRSDRSCRRRQSPRITSGILTTIVAAVSVVTAAFQFGLPWWMQAGDHNHLYESDALQFG